MKTLLVLVTISIWFAKTTSLADTLYSDGSTKKGWAVYDADPTGATIESVDLGDGDRAIQLSGAGLHNGFRLRSEDGLSMWQNHSELVIQWDMKFTTPYKIYISLSTEQGLRYLTYTPFEQDGTQDDRVIYIYHDLGPVGDGQWHTITRDLVRDLADLEPTNQIIAVNAFLVRGNGLIDNVRLLSTLPMGTDCDNDALTDEEETAMGTNPSRRDTDRDGIPDGWDENPLQPESRKMVENGNDVTDWIIYDNSPEGATVNTVALTNNDRVVQFNGSRLKNGFRLSLFGESRTAIRWEMNFSQYYVFLVKVITPLGMRYLAYRSYTQVPISDAYIEHNIRTDAPVDGQWHLIKRDLALDLDKGEPGNTVLSIEAFLVRGTGYVDNIELLDVRTLENGNDASDWKITDATSKNPSVYVVTEGENSIIQFSGHKQKDAFGLTNLNETQRFSIDFDLRFSEHYSFVITATTSLGIRYLAYRSKTIDQRDLFLEHNIETLAPKDGAWHSMTIDLEADLSTKEPGNTIQSIESFEVRGSGNVDNITLY